MSHVTNLSRLPPLPRDQSHPHRGTLYEHTAALALSRHHRRSQCSGRERERKIEEENKREDEGERSPGERLRGGQEGAENIQPAEEEEGGGGVSREEEGEVLPE